MTDKETLARLKDDAWCDGFLTAWNVQACAREGMTERIEELDALLEEAIRQLAVMVVPAMLADMMKESR